MNHNSFSEWLIEQGACLAGHAYVVEHGWSARDAWNQNEHPTWHIWLYSRDMALLQPGEYFARHTQLVKLVSAQLMDILQDERRRPRVAVAHRLLLLDYLGWINTLPVGMPLHARERGGTYTWDRDEELGRLRMIPGAHEKLISALDVFAGHGVATPRLAWHPIAYIAPLLGVVDTQAPSTRGVALTQWYRERLPAPTICT